LLGELGFRDHVSEIRSFEKFTGEGTTFVTTDLVRILEEVLPALLGGTSGDYQLLEEQGEGGLSTTSLIVSPRVGLVAEAEVRMRFLEAIARLGEVERQMARIWSEAGTLEVRRAEPVATEAGKVFPYQLLKTEQAGRMGRSDGAHPRAGA
jgi:hypothetical protein